LCPFCYIGKRKFEAALEQFQDKENVEIVWKSFQLSPELKTQPGKIFTVIYPNTKAYLWKRQTNERSLNSNGETSWPGL